MIPVQPMAMRPLVLLTLVVLALHLLLLRQARWLAPPQEATIRVLLTRVVNDAPPTAQPSAFIQKRVLQEPAALPLPSRFTRAAAAAPPALIDSAPAPAPVAAQPSPAIAFAIPAPVRLHYSVTGQSRGRAWSVDGQLHWRHDGSQYEASLAYAAPSTPSHSQQSTGRITAEGLAPLRFSEKNRGERATHFERDSATLVFSSNAPQLPLLAGAQDRVSVFLQLASMLAAAPAKFPPGTEISVQTAGTRDAQAWVFVVEADEELALPGGTVPTRKLQRMPLREYDTRVELWLGTGMDYVPVRLRLTQPNGDSVDHQWSSTDRS